VARLSQAPTNISINNGSGVANNKMMANGGGAGSISQQQHLTNQMNLSRHGGGQGQQLSASQQQIQQ